MGISRVSAIGLPMAASAASMALTAQAPEIKRLELNTNRPLLAIPELGADLRYFIEQAGQANQAEKTAIYWIANRGKQTVHFTPIWVMRDGKPRPMPEDKPYVPAPRVHLSQYGRMHLAPPEGFKELLLTEIRIGDDTGPFIEIKDTREGAGKGGLR